MTFIKNRCEISFLFLKILLLKGEGNDGDHTLEAKYSIKMENGQRGGQTVMLGGVFVIDHGFCN